MEMNNNLMGDSIKKVRYSDSIIMIRQRADLDIFNSAVAADVNVDNAVSINDSSSDYLQSIIPFGAKITKAKDGDRGANKFHIFNKKNLRIYDSIGEVIEDHKLCVQKSNELLNKLSIIGLTGADIDNEILYDDNDPFENLIL